MSGIHIPSRLRRQVRRRAGRACEYCRFPEVSVWAGFHCDHFRPRADGGETVASNLVWACPNCNQDKRELTIAIDPRTRLYVPIFNPRLDAWDRHFAWTENKLNVRGTTPIGRATVRLLRMNRSKARHLRYLLLLANEHPADK
jgi:5-methylcytosine-specific restriction endonuclease McrA